MSWLFFSLALLLIVIKVTAASEPLSVPPSLTAADLGAFFDGILQTQLAQRDTAGAVVAVVHGRQVLFARGYGYSDMESGKGVSVEETLFRAGSISKTLIWTAVMQLWEQGRIRLDADINDYLDFYVPAPFYVPVTMLHLMSHTAGWEEELKDSMTNSLTGLMSLEDYVHHNLPRQIFQPGTVPAYSNYGADLAAYIVQRISGQPFERYIDDHIFQPLNMSLSSFAQPLPEHSCQRATC